MLMSNSVLLLHNDLKSCHVFLFCLSDVPIGDKKLSTILGELIWEECSQCIIHECLVYSIPTNSSELDEYSAVGTVCIDDNATNHEACRA